MTDDSPDELRGMYENGAMWTEGRSVEYRGYTLEKVESVGLSPCHTEFQVLNRAGRKVESFTAGAFGGFEAFRNRLDEVIEYDPDSLCDWLHRNDD